MSTFYSSNKSPNILTLHSAKWHKNHLVSMQYIVYILGIHCLKTCVIQKLYNNEKAEYIGFFQLTCDSDLQFQII